MTDKLKALPHVVIYGALSEASDDPDMQSIATQHAAVVARLNQLHGQDGYVIVGTFEDDGYSGSKRNRGPGLQAAIDAAVAAAAEHGAAELWANTAARFGRGTSKPNEARAIGELFYAMRRQGVALRAVVDDEMVSNEMLVGIGSTLAAKYASDLGESVRRAKRRKVASGERPGGPPRDGYRIVYQHDASGRVVGRSYEFDPERAPIWREAFALALDGTSTSEIARSLNARGHRTRRSGNPFDRRGIEQGLSSPFYAGRIAYLIGTPDEQVVDGHHPPLIDPADFDRLQRRLKATREHGPRPKRGRPPANHALARLATCWTCGSRMLALTSSYRRADGTRHRYYRCAAVHAGTGTCDAPPVDAEIVDAGVIEELDRLLIDFDAWRQRIEHGHLAEGQRLAQEVERARADHAELTRTADLAHRAWLRYLERDDGSADAVLPAVQSAQADADAAQRRLQAAQAAYASIPAHADTDALLDFANDLREAIRGKLDRANGAMAAVNAALREVFAGFSLRVGEWAGIEDGHVAYAGRPAVIVVPLLRADVAYTLADPLLLPTDEDAAPVLRWLRIAAGGPSASAPSAPATYPPTASSPTTSAGKASASGRTV